MTALVVIQGIVVLLLMLLVVGLLRSHAEILKALHDLGINLEEGATTGGTRTFGLGSRSDAAQRAAVATERDRHDLEGRVGESGLATPAEGPLGAAHDLMGTTAGGDAVAVSLSDGKGLTLLAFLSTGCMTCLDFWEAFRDPSNRAVAGAGSDLLVITRGPDAESPAAVAEIAEAGLDTMLSSEAWDDYSVPVAPYFVLVDRAGGRIIGEGAAASFEQLQSLMAKAVADGGFAPGGGRTRASTLRAQRDRLSADEALEAAGIGPGHPSLHQDPEGDRSGR